MKNIPCTSSHEPIIPHEQFILIEQITKPHVQNCHTRFSKEQNQTNHTCAQKIHTYVRMKKYQKQFYYITYT
jgi:hypothetical protein